jgi:FtsP/CotA-like multicopper oxidase with cupredoxin domain
MLGAVASSHACDHAAVRREHLSRAAAAVGVLLLVVLVAFVAKAWNDSRLPATYSVMSFGAADYGGGPASPAHAGHEDGHGGGIGVADLRGPGGPPDVRFELTARKATLRLASGRTVDALTFDGRAPGPELRVHEGDLVEVALRNADVPAGVTIHWHGVDVPNAEDGVAGVTQNAVLPGQSYTYRFRAEQVGTFWYHTHQVSSEEVQRGLFGALVIERRAQPSGVLDRVLLAHTFDGVATLNGADEPRALRVRPGTAVRIRLVNSDSAVRRFDVGGAAFRVLAIDGTDLNAPSLLDRVSLPLAAGGRYDVGFVMPAHGVRVELEDSAAALDLTTPTGRPAPPAPGAVERVSFDPLDYGRPAPAPFSASSPFDRDFHLTITKKLGFFDGKPGRQWALNGRIYPNVPMFVVEEGDLVRLTIANHSKVVHPMHLHGHHALVLSRNGEPATGSPWWTDTLNVGPGDEYVVAFRANNPGIWMDHCHNLGHAAAGLTMHLAYAGITTPFVVGGGHDNTPE